jgi:polysaccharide biosynthesis/export protein
MTIPPWRVANCSQTPAGADSGLGEVSDIMETSLKRHDHQLAAMKYNCAPSTFPVRRCSGGMGSPTWLFLLVAFLVHQTGMLLTAAEPAPQLSLPSTSAAAIPDTRAALPAEYVIGPDDVLNIVFWQEKDLSGEVVVRPDGNISLPLLNDLKAAGMTPTQLRERILEQARRYIEDPNATVVVKQVNSRKVFITGQVHKPGGYPLTGPTTVVQLIATAGGLADYASIKNIFVVRNENGRQISFPVNYKDILDRKNLAQNIELKPGDTVIVP